MTGRLGTTLMTCVVATSYLVFQNLSPDIQVFSLDTLILDSAWYFFNVQLSQLSVCLRECVGVAGWLFAPLLLSWLRPKWCVFVRTGRVSLHSAPQRRQASAGVTGVTWPRRVCRHSPWGPRRAGTPGNQLWGACASCLSAERGCWG